jgi:diguanylate cyclase (GGDEF)-like protein
MIWAELPLKLKAYIVTLTCIAIPIAIWAGWDVLNGTHDSGWFVLALLTVVTIPAFLLLPSFNASITVGDAYIMAIGMMYGIGPCILTTFLHTFFISVWAQRPKKYAHRVVFNTASTICASLIYSVIYRALNRGSSQLMDIIIPAALMVIAYFFINSILTSIAIAWSVGEGVLKFWAKSCMPLAVDYSISAVCATSIVALYNVNKYIPIAVAPLIGVAWGWNKLNQSRIMEAEKHLRDQEQLYLRTVESLALAVDAKDQTTYGHIRRVKVYATGLAKLCGIKDIDELRAIETGSLLHDIGKIAIDDYILNKPGRLTEQEFEKIKMHAAAGDEILQQVHFPFPVAKYVRYHHERWDGQGYPDGLKGEQIPLGARILAIADAFDAIRFSRPYKLSMAKDETIDILRTQAGTVYDPHLIDIFLEHVDELEHAAISASVNVPELSFRKHTVTLDRALAKPLYNPTVHRDIAAELVQVSEFCNAIAGHLDLKEILHIFARRIERIIPYTTCAFFLDSGDDRLCAIHASGKNSEALQGSHIEMGKGISGWVAAYRRPMINTGPALEFQNIQGDFSSFTDALVVPLVYEDKSLGTISLYTQKPIPYNHYELNNLQTLAGYLAPMISESKRMGTQDSDVIDPTTQIHRIPYLSAVGPQLISYAGKNRSPVSLIYLEIKNLAQITRIFGEILTNSILRKIAECIKPELRETDILVRYGHQAFVAFLPGVRDQQALRCVQRLKQQIKSEVPVTALGFTIDCRAGISSYPKNGATVFALLQSAQDSMGADVQETAASDSNVVGFPPRA